MNSAFAQLIASRIKAAIGSASAMSGLDHAVLRGSLREAFVRNLLRPVLPARLGFAHGLIASANEEQSTEQDVVIIGAVPIFRCFQTNAPMPGSA